MPDPLTRIVPPTLLLDAALTATPDAEPVSLPPDLALLSPFSPLLPHAPTNNMAAPTASPRPTPDRRATTRLPPGSTCPSFAPSVTDTDGAPSGIGLFGSG